MTDLFPVTLAEQVACVRREIGKREGVYPRMVANKQMSQAMADRETAAMRAVLESLHRLEGLEK